MRPVSPGRAPRSTHILASGGTRCEGRVMRNDTSGTSPDPELGSEGDTNQLTTEGTLLDRGLDDALDEGYTVPERPRSNHNGETPGEEAHRETIDQLIGEEDPEVWKVRDIPAEDCEQFRAGRLVEDD